MDTFSDFQQEVNSELEDIPCDTSKLNEKNSTLPTKSSGLPIILSDKPVENKKVFEYPEDN